MTEFDSQQQRIEAIVGNEQQLSFEAAIERFYQHLKKSLKLPCDVTGIEDFRWEEYYVFGPGNSAEYQRLRRTQPSYQDTFRLIAIENQVFSEWMMFGSEDLAGHVKRKSDGVEFYLGLAEIEAVEQDSQNHQRLDDYSVWFVNSR